MAIAETYVELPQNPQSDTGGSFYKGYVLPDYSHDLGAPELIRSRRDEVIDGAGTNHLEYWDMHDAAGTRYKVMRCMAENPVTPVWVVKDTAWGTQVEGLNSDIVAPELMSKGFNVLIKGPEIGSRLRQSQSAFNTHRLLDALESKGDLRAEYIAVEGYSRGAMVGFGTNAYAAQFGREVIYSNLTDPCVALPIGLNLETIKKAAWLPLDIAMLAISAAGSLRDLERAIKLARTVNFSKEGFSQFVSTGYHLMDGEAGAMAARTPKGMNATVAFFDQCHMNDKDIFRQILRNRLGVRFVPPKGGHGEGIEKRVIDSIARRFGALASELVAAEADGRTPQQIDFRRVTHGLEVVN